MKFKEIKRNGVFCWCPTRQQRSVAIGTTSQQFDTNFSNDSKLEIFDLNAEECSEEPRLKSSKVVTNTFNCLQWHPYALIGGTQLKTLQFFDVTADETELKYETEAQTSSVTCIALNPKESHSVATGCDDGSVGVWDIDSGGKALSSDLDSHSPWLLSHLHQVTLACHPS
ncbi:unnamed protein product [Oppiella nova]|uniref:Uncharacterized protein n=1 Tax=Oppiella nova TaxID=334625 RepID=A0A7R9LBA1_9ACAR|nr:unnamed protein product [Oppiella nova]CAG2161679.1 unnamed protein product [Oppiella nova]